MGTAKCQKICWIITQTGTIIWVSSRETDLIVVQYMEYELQLVLHSQQSVKTSYLIPLGYILIIKTGTTVATVQQHTFIELNFKEPKKEGKTSKKQPNPTQYKHDRDPFLP